MKIYIFKFFFKSVCKPDVQLHTIAVFFMGQQQQPEMQVGNRLSLPYSLTFTTKHTLMLLKHNYHPLFLFSVILFSTLL